MKKKIIALTIASAMMFSLYGCGSKKSVNFIKRENVVLAQEAITYDYTDKALEYMNYIGTNLADRDSQSADSDHQATIDFIISELTNAGYSQDQISIVGNSSSNIVLDIAGQSSDKLVIVGGHYDGDGVGDNGSGLALMLANAVGLYGTTPKYDVRFVFFDAEEVGMVGSSEYADSLSDEDVARTAYMVNIDAILFGDYCNVYGGVTDHKTGEVTQTGAYELACAKARYLGLNVWGPEDLDGYYAEHKIGPDVETYTIYTSPWTYEHKAPIHIMQDLVAYSPSTIPFSDHVPFMGLGIDYVYFEATNWFAKGNKIIDAYTGYYESYDTSLGDGGMFMNTKYDTLDELNEHFPERAEEHFRIYSPLLSSLILNPDSETVLG